MSERNYDPWYVTRNNTDEMAIFAGFVDPSDPDQVATLQSEYCGELGLFESFKNETLEPGETSRAVRRVSRAAEWAIESGYSAINTQLFLK